MIDYSPVIGRGIDEEEEKLQDPFGQVWAILRLAERVITSFVEFI